MSGGSYLAPFHRPKYRLAGSQPGNGASTRLLSGRAEARTRANLTATFAAASVVAATRSTGAIPESLPWWRQGPAPRRRRIRLARAISDNDRAGSESDNSPE